MPKRKHVARKGIELPINTLVVVAVAVIILLGVVAFFMGGFSGVSSSMQKRQTFLNSCQPFVQLECKETLTKTHDIVKNYYAWTTVDGTVPQTPDYDNIKRACGCFGGTAGTTTPQQQPTTVTGKLASGDECTCGQCNAQCTSGASIKDAAKNKCYCT